MTHSLSLLAAALIALSPTASGDDAPSGRDGSYQFADGLSVAGTMWKGDMEPQGFLVVRFMPDGQVIYTYSGGTWSNGTWKQNGTSVSMVIGRANVKFEGVIGGDRITGTGTTGPTHKRRWLATRVGPISKEELAGMNIKQ